MRSSPCITPATFSRACRPWGIESEKAAERGQIVTISPAHSGTMVKESGEIWTAETLLQPIRPKSVMLLQSIEISHLCMTRSK